MAEEESRRLGVARGAAGIAPHGVRGSGGRGRGEGVAGCCREGGVRSRPLEGAGVGMRGGGGKREVAADEGAGHRIRSKSFEREGASGLRGVGVSHTARGGGGGGGRLVSGQAKRECGIRLAQGREKRDDAEEEGIEGRAGKETGSSRCRWRGRRARSRRETGGGGRGVGGVVGEEGVVGYVGCATVCLQGEGSAGLA